MAKKAETFGCALGTCNVTGTVEDTYTFSGGTELPLMWKVVDLDSSSNPLERHSDLLCVHHHARHRKNLQSKMVKDSRTGETRPRMVRSVALKIFLEKQAQFQAEAQARSNEVQAEKAAFEALLSDVPSVEVTDPAS